MIKEKIVQKKRNLFRLNQYFLFIVFLWMALLSCEGSYIVSGKVFAMNGEPLPGVSISSTEALNHTITDVTGEFTLRLQKPITRLEFVKSDYLPIQMTINSWNGRKVLLPNIILTSKPSSPGVFLLDEKKNKYIPLPKGKIERVQINSRNSIPAVKTEVTLTLDIGLPRLYVFRLPQYELSLYRLKEYRDDEESNKINKDKEKEKKQTVNNQPDTEEKIWIPEEPVLIHTEFLSPLDPSLMIVKPVDTLKEGKYCLNWRAFELLSPKINEGYLFSIQLPQEEREKKDNMNTETDDDKKITKENES